MSQRLVRLIWWPVLLMLSGCLGMPDGVKPVENFDRQAYLGQWYEIARLDHSFERGLSHVTAEYSLRDDGGIRVINRGYDVDAQEWKSAEGRAYFTDEPQVAHLKVSFFGPFFSSYVVFGLDHENYQYAFVSGYNRNYLWLLARSPEVDDGVLSTFTEKAQQLGFDTGQLIFPDHQPIPSSPKLD
ncbi:lipocalin family protein [Porticoccus litoralis]|uniref:Outer membrane lipoprotein Blc n=1 Tax=Porticoccus litoralis TaxID=434086 RepID=A0AAW8B6J2_9GAMM|nr:lipocalin family protein [Porticoccus litoralis]MDP1521440.1 lipocalin family protein [Porticoccus litoralis]